MVKQILLSISLEEFQKIVSDCVRSELKKNKGEPPKTETDFIGARQAASILKISLPTLRKYTHQSRILSYRIGRTVRYKKDEVEKSVQPIRFIKHSRLQAV